MHWALWLILYFLVLFANYNCRIAKKTAENKLADLYESGGNPFNFDQFYDRIVDSLDQIGEVRKTIKIYAILVKIFDVIGLAIIFVIVINII